MINIHETLSSLSAQIKSYQATLTNTELPPEQPQIYARIIQVLEDLHNTATQTLTEANQTILDQYAPSPGLVSKQSPITVANFGEHIIGTIVKLPVYKPEQAVREAENINWRSENNKHLSKTAKIIAIEEDHTVRLDLDEGKHRYAIEWLSISFPTYKEGTTVFLPMSPPADAPRIGEDIGYTQGMSPYLGKIATITTVSDDHSYRLNIDKGHYWWAHEWLTPAI